MSIEFNIGDTVWFANCGTKEVRHECPVCFGKCSVRLELGNGGLVSLMCDFCGHGHEGPRGYVTEYEWIAEPACIVINQKNVTEHDGKREITYQSPNHYIGHPEDVFTTKQEAAERCELRIKEHAADEKKRLEWSKERNHKSYSWHAGYHMREVKEARRKLEWHSARAIHCKARAKEPEATP